MKLSRRERIFLNETMLRRYNLLIFINKRKIHIQVNILKKLHHKALTLESGFKVYGDLTRSPIEFFLHPILFFCTSIQNFSFKTDLMEMTNISLLLKNTVLLLHPPMSNQ